MITTILSFVLAIGVLVTVHEFGHFWVARRLGVKVLRFSIGFGRPLWKRTAADGVEYVVAAIPLGGYVKMLDEAEGPVAPADLDGAFNRKKLWIRTAVVAAGPAFNFAFAIFAYWVVFVMGVSGLAAFVGDVTPNSVAERSGLEKGHRIVIVDSGQANTWVDVVQRTLGGLLKSETVPATVVEPSGARRDLSLNFGTVGVDDLTEGRFFDALGVEPLRPLLPAIVDRLTPDGAAEAGGMEPGDHVVAVDGTPVKGWGDWVETIQASPKKPLVTEVVRDGRRVELVLTPNAREHEGRTVGFIGAYVRRSVEGLERYYVKTSYGPVDALGKAMEKTWDVSVLTLRMFWKMVQLEVSLENLSGPITIARYAGDSARSGPVQFFEFLAIVSISLGILNLLPIPILDGGHLVYFALEAVSGKPPSDELRYIGQHIGLVFLVGLMGLAFYNDISRLLG